MRGNQRLVEVPQRGNLRVGGRTMYWMIGTVQPTRSVERTGSVAGQYRRDVLELL